MLISWKQGLSGDFATASNWNPAAVPGPGDDAIIGAKGTYTVTSSVNETVDSLIVEKKHATVFVTGGSSFTTTNGGVNDGTILVDNGSVLTVGTVGESTTLANLGKIELGSAANGQFVVVGDVSLEGHGKVTLSDNPNNVVAGNGSPATLSTDNVISGAGTVGGGLPGSFFFTLVNEVGGIIDATGVNALAIQSATVVENSGILESTNPEGLSTPGGLLINPFSAIKNTPLGVIEANGANTHVSMAGDVVVGGTLETRGANAVIDIHLDGNVLDGTQAGNPVNIVGNVLITPFTTVELMGTINNTGMITAASESGTSALIVLQGNVTLEGGGHVTLINSGPTPPPPTSAIFGGVLTNVDNVISGTGLIDEIFGGPAQGILINEAKGTIDADAGTPLILTAAGSDINAGLIEATQTATLLIENVTIDNFLNHTNGTVEAGKDSTVGLENATITGGFVKALSGSIIEADQGSNTITGAEVKNGGTIGAEGANLTIVGDVFNIKGDLDANNGTLVIDGAVKGGTATLEGTGKVEFGGASSAHVTFAATSDAILKLDDPSAFKGTVSGLTTGDSVDLTNINFADNPTLSYSSKTHVLTVTDSVSHVTDTIKFAGVVGSFSAQGDGNGGTLISDPSPATTKMVTASHDSFVFASNLGENSGKTTNADVQHNEPIDFTHHSGEFADLAALMAQAYAEGAHVMAGPDAIEHHAAALTAHHFSV